ncbi:FAD-dependent oxidoreductase [Streptosporangium sp. NPDC002524]|uniref:flavin monoamine oxidase family protein n=1 Tax=Streptosporangium sp. NPDC002524 TaxID=3154537 RepID=UPI00331DC566
MTDETDDTADVVVIGAGVAGLACARELTARGFRVVVAEARPAIGGRVRTLRTGLAGPVELGAQVVHPARCDAFDDLLREERITTAPMEPAAGFVVVSEGAHHDAAALAARVRPLPWVAEDGLYASHPLSGTVGRALSGLAPPARALARSWMEQVVGQDPALLDLAETAASYHGRGRGGERVVVDGFDRVVHALAGGLDIRTGSPAERLRWGTGGVEVATASAVIRARAAVVTPPPPVVAGGLVLDPPLPRSRIGAAEVLASCDAVVVVLVSAAPAARSRSFLLTGPPGGLWTRRAGSRLTTGHVKGPSARLARRPGWENDLIRSLGPGLGGVDDVLVMDWGRDPWSRGAYSVPVAGAGAASAAWAEPLGDTVFFAGEASAAPELRGLVQGALASGLRAAAEVALSLSGGPHDQRTGRDA